MALKGNFYYISEPLANYRLHSDSATSAILEQDLIGHYSKVEFILALYSLVDLQDDKFDNRLSIELKNTLVNLMRCYDTGSKKWKKFASRIHVQGEADYFEKEYYKLLESHQHLIAQHNEYKYFKQSKIYRLYEMFSNKQ